MTLELGQKLWFVYRERRSGEPHFVTVTKIGRKWAETTPDGWSVPRFRVDIHTLKAEAGQYTSPGRCWISKEAWEADKRRHEAWARLRRLIEHKYSAPDDVSTEAIEQAISTLSPHERASNE